MSTVSEIEHAIEQLPAAEFAKLRQWFLELDSARWDQEMDADSESGRLDFLFEEAADERARGELRDWPGTEA